MLQGKQLTSIRLYYFVMKEDGEFLLVPACPSKLEQHLHEPNTVPVKVRCKKDKQF